MALMWECDEYAATQPLVINFNMTDKILSLILFFIASLAMCGLFYFIGKGDAAAIAAAENGGTAFSGAGGALFYLIYMSLSGTAILIFLVPFIIMMCLRKSKFPHLSKASVFLRSLVIPFETFTILFVVFMFILFLTGDHR